MLIKSDGITNWSARLAPRTSPPIKTAITKIAGSRIFTNVSRSSRRYQSNGEFASPRKSFQKDETPPRRSKESNSLLTSSSRLKWAIPILTSKMAMMTSPTKVQSSTASLAQTITALSAWSKTAIGRIIKTANKFAARIEVVCDDTTTAPLTINKQFVVAKANICTNKPPVGNQIP